MFEHLPYCLRAFFNSPDIYSPPPPPTTTTYYSVREGWVTETIHKVSVLPSLGTLFVLGKWYFLYRLVWRPSSCVRYWCDHPPPFIVRTLLVRPPPPPPSSCVRYWCRPSIINSIVTVIHAHMMNNHTFIFIIRFLHPLKNINLHILNL